MEDVEKYQKSVVVNMFLYEDEKKSDVSLSLKLRYIFHLPLDISY